MFLASFDIEDWFHAENIRTSLASDDWNALPGRVERNTHQLLDILGEAGATSTFFVLGWIARRYPALVRRIVDEGHELASHTDLHKQLRLLGRSDVERELKQSRESLEQAAGTRVLGVRAPNFSISEDVLDAHRGGRLLVRLELLRAARSRPLRPALARRSIPMRRSSRFGRDCSSSRCRGCGSDVARSHGPAAPTSARSRIPSSAPAWRGGCAAVVVHVLSAPMGAGRPGGRSRPGCRTRAGCGPTPAAGGCAATCAGCSRNSDLCRVDETLRALGYTPP